MAGQQPTTGVFPAFDVALAANRNRVSREVFGVSDATTLSSIQSASLATTGYEAAMAVTQLGRWFSELNPTTADLGQQFNELFHLEWVARLIREFRSPQDAHAYRTTQIDPMVESVLAHGSTNWESSSFLASTDVTPQTIRRSAISILIRRRLRAYAPIPDIDRVIQEEFLTLWDMRRWPFRRRPVHCTINTTGEIIIGDTDVVFDGFASKYIELRMTNGGRRRIEWRDSSLWAADMARWGDETGMPVHFYVIDEGNSKSVQFLPAPDTTYEAFAVVYMAAPSLGGATATTGLSALPAPFRSHLRDRVVAKLLSEYGQPTDADRWQAMVARTQEGFLHEFADTGNHEVTARGKSAFHLIHAATSFSSPTMNSMG